MKNRKQDPSKQLMLTEVVTPKERKDIVLGLLDSAKTDLTEVEYIELMEGILTRCSSTLQEYFGIRA